MISEEDKLEIRTIVLQELYQLLGDVRNYSGDTGSVNDGSLEARQIAPAILRAISPRLQNLQAEKDRLRGGQR